MCHLLHVFFIIFKLFSLLATTKKGDMKRENTVQSVADWIHLANGKDVFENSNEKVFWWREKLKERKEYKFKWPWFPLF